MYVMYNNVLVKFFEEIFVEFVEGRLVYMA